MNSQQQERIQVLFEKYLENKCSRHELDELFHLIKQDSEGTLLSLLIDMEFHREDTSGLVIPDETKRSMLATLSAKLSEAGAKRTQGGSVFRPYLKMAAVFLAAITVTIFLYLYWQTAQTEYVEQRTAFGQVMEIRLPDSSTVILNGNSSLRYPTDFRDRKLREVHLKGEGFFKVVHLSNDQGFSVHTDGGISIKVLGTEFNVNNRRSRTQVVLQSGKIRLDIGGTEQKAGDILMKSGDYVEVRKDNETVTRKKVDSDIYTSWVNRKFIFKDTPVREILHLLEDNYGIVSSVKDTSVLDEKFTATYPSDNIEILTKALEKSFKIELKRVHEVDYR